MTRPCESTDTNMIQFTRHTLWTAAPETAQFDVSEVILSAAQEDQLVAALKIASPTLQNKLDAFRSISLSEAAAFSRVR